MAIGWMVDGNGTELLILAQRHLRGVA